MQRSARETADLTELVNIHYRLADMFLGQAFQADSIGDFYIASKYALYAWAHYRHYEAYAGISCARAFLHRDFTKCPFYYNEQEELERAREFAEYLLQQKKEGKPVILLSLAPS